MDNKYQRGKIYKIFSPQTNDIYIGSTIEKTLARRMSHHMTDFRRTEAGANVRPTMACRIIANPEFDIVLLESYPCNSKDELNAREQYWIDLNQDICINRNRAHGVGPRNVPVQCGCGGKYHPRNIKDHERTQRHQQFLQIQ